MSFISQRHGQFKYFDLQLGHPTWRGKRVLDFGGNIGNLLRDPKSTIEHEKYWSMDVSKDAIEKGKKDFPKAHWVFYDRYNFAFNSTGIEGLELPPLGQEFDYILAYSVFTHTKRSEMIDLISQLENWLTAEGVLAFTFIDPHFNPSKSNGNIRPGYYHGTCLRQRLERMKQHDPAVDVLFLLEKARGARWCILLNDHDLYIESEVFKYYDSSDKRSLCAFYTADYLQATFPDASVLAPPPSAYAPSAESVLQHCCVLRKDRGR